MSKISKTEQEWAQQLTREQFQVCRKKGTERPFSGEYCDCKTPGLYRCSCCGEALFDSEAKYDSGSGWPSFWQPVEAGAVAESGDGSRGMQRVEVLCSACDAHLGHVFPDGPQPTGLRYCINSLSLRLEHNDEQGD